MAEIGFFNDEEGRIHLQKEIFEHLGFGEITLERLNAVHMNFFNVYGE